MSYAELLEAARRDPLAVNFSELRAAYAQSTAYDPYDANPELQDALMRVVQAASADDANAVVEAAKQALAVNYFNLNTHMTASLAYRKLGDDEQANFHREFANAWLESIHQSGDGLSFDTAFAAVSLDEEYAVLRKIGCEMQRRHMEEHAGHIYDIFFVYFPAQEAGGELFFNVDPVVQAVGEGRAELPYPSTILGSRPKRTCLRLELNVRAEETVATVKACLQEYLTSAGYKALSDSLYGRGSRWGTWFSLSLRRYKVRVSTVVEAVTEDFTKMRAIFDIYVPGGTIAEPERRFWESEVSGLGDAVLTGKIDAAAQAADAKRASKSLTRQTLLYLGVLLAGALVLGLVVMLVNWLFVDVLPAKVSWWGAFANSPSAAIGIIVALVLISAASRIWRRLQTHGN